MLSRFKTCEAANKRGAALLTVLVAIMIISLMTLELQYTAMVERKLAYNDLNQLQAYYLAKSGAKLGLLRLALYGRARNAKLGGADIKPFLDGIWNIPLPAFPPAKSALNKLTKSDKDNAEKVLDETKVSEGQFSHVISSEAAKINLNFLIIPEAERNKDNNAFNFISADPPKTLVEYVGKLLFNLIEDILKKSNNPVDEFGNIRPDEVVYDIMDWVNSGSVRIGSSGKDSFYEQQKPPYKAKRGRFFTLEELKLVKSVEENLYNKLKNHVTVYSYDGKINLNDASKDLLKAIFPDFTEDDLKRIAEEKAKTGVWASEKAFVEFVVTTLGRSNFKTLYSDENKYPFTVNSFSFLIESLGILQKGKTQVQRKIRVAATLTRAKGAKPVANNKSKEECDKDPDLFFYLAANACFPRPTNEKDCLNGFAGQWTQENEQFGCRLNNQGMIFPNKNAKAQEPNAVKILYWTEA